MEKRINKVLLLVTIALLGPIGLGTVMAAPVAPLAEANSEAQVAPLIAAAPGSAPATLALRAANAPLLSKSSSGYPLLVRNWTYTAFSTLYERNAAHGNSVALTSALSPLRPQLHPGSSAGGLWRLSLFIPAYQTSLGGKDVTNYVPTPPTVQGRDLSWPLPA